MTLAPANSIASVKVALKLTQVQLERYLVSIQPIRLSQNLTSEIEFD